MKYYFVYVPTVFSIKRGKIGIDGQTNAMTPRDGTGNDRYWNVRAHMWSLSLSLPSPYLPVIYVASVPYFVSLTKYERNEGSKL